MINDVVAALREILEPDPAPPGAPEVVKDLTAAKPFTHEPKKLYVWADRVAEVEFESGTSRRQDFVVRAVLTGDDVGEEPQMARNAAVSAFLDGRRGQYFAAVRANQVHPSWLHLRAAEEGPGPATLQVRSIGLRLSGYRIVGP